MKASELRGFSDADLQRRLQEFRHELFNLRFQLATRRLENTARIRIVRKDVARILQIINQRRQAAPAGEP
jgi:large subunit ribosomal protein L29